jgi:CRISPR-associated protein Csb2
MPVTIAIRWPLGRYHATPWDRSVNEGAVEWPPSPWRILRALVATWYTRWPDLPAPALDDLLGMLSEPPAYLTPPVQPGHTRHYMPDIDHKKGETGNTALTLDPHLHIPRDAELLVRWNTELNTDQREILTKLVGLIPYLGRADSVCQARLLDTNPTPDGSWWTPGSGTGETTRLLAPIPPVRRPVLEATTVEVRSQRRTMPPETHWITYTRATAATPPAHPQRPDPIAKVEAIRFAVVSDAPFKATHGVLLADEVHRRVARELDGENTTLFGGNGASTDHQHAHWIPIPESPERGAPLTGLLVWVPRGLTAREVAAIVTVSTRRLSGKVGGDGYEWKGFPATRLLLQAAGRVNDAAPEFHAPTRHWRSITPYLPVHHRKRNKSLDSYLQGDVQAELRYRGLPQATVKRIESQERLPDRWALEFRRYRRTERINLARPGLGLTLEFAEPLTGPLLIGQLSHFGYGAFLPTDVEVRAGR